MKTGQVKRELGRLAAREKERESLLTDESHVDRTAALAAEAAWLEGARFNPGASQEKVAAWVDGLGL